MVSRGFNMLENWEIKALEHDLLDYNSWAAHAVKEKIYPDKETALHDKALKCAGRMINMHESTHSSLVALTTSGKVDACYAKSGYKNRVQRDAEV